MSRTSRGGAALPLAQEVAKHLGPMRRKPKKAAKEKAAAEEEEEEEEQEEQQEEEEPVEEPAAEEPAAEAAEAGPAAAVDSSDDEAGAAGNAGGGDDSSADEAEAERRSGKKKARSMPNDVFGCSKCRWAPAGCGACRENPVAASAPAPAPAPTPAASGEKRARPTDLPPGWTAEVRQATSTRLQDLRRPERRAGAVDPQAWRKCRAAPARKRPQVYGKRKKSAPAAAPPPPPRRAATLPGRRRRRGRGRRRHRRAFAQAEEGGEACVARTPAEVVAMLKPKAKTAEPDSSDEDVKHFYRTGDVDVQCARPSTGTTRATLPSTITAVSAS